MNLRKHLLAAQQKLAQFPSARLDAEILMAHALDSPRSFLYANPELDLPLRHSNSFKKLIRRRSRGEPIAYITGVREFWSLTLRITPDVLIPRHETELLVEVALQRIPPSELQKIADLGTGSGAIALAIASERPGCSIHATDLSKAAISLAEENANRLGTKVQFHHGSWCEPLSGQFEMIVSNPPYIGANDPHLKQGDVRFEPALALSPGTDALSEFRVIAEQASERLTNRGWLILEHGTDQASDVRDILASHEFTKIETMKDLAGHERVTLCCK
ncbi:MAG: release factor glutamine methyltransferase [Lysobacterales bacterium]